MRSGGTTLTTLGTPRMMRRHTVLVASLLLGALALLPLACRTEKQTEKSRAARPHATPAPLEQDSAAPSGTPESHDGVAPKICSLPKLEGAWGEKATACTKDADCTASSLTDGVGCPALCRSVAAYSLAFEEALRAQRVGKCACPVAKCVGSTEIQRARCSHGRCTLSPNPAPPSAAAAPPAPSTAPSSSSAARAAPRPYDRMACLQRCRRRNMSMDCAGPEGMTACPCNCP